MPAWVWRDVRFFLFYFYFFCACSAPCMHASEEVYDRLIDRLTEVFCAGHIELCCLPEFICVD